ncbi:MAG: hypothetical protein LBO81_03270, partial [Clostridiales Family XIII bacterium]|jgi:predicted amidohydrolase|nr:hypothetical protein [Clostridiales Family XIII bacterium]
LIPAAFYRPRIDHWTGLIQSIALHNSVYALGVNLFGKWDDRNVFCGRSLLADPWGVAVAQASDKPCAFHSYVERDYPGKIRDAIGSFRNRVPSVYDIPSV